MPYQSARIPFEPYCGPSAGSTDVFVHSGKPTAIDWPLGKRPKIAEGRQAHFAAQLYRLSRNLQSVCIPVRIRWSSEERNQMDKGCIGHAFGPDLMIESVAIDHQNQVTHVILSRGWVEHYRAATEGGSRE